MKVLIAGGFGFVGSRIAQALATAGCEISLGSRTARGAPEWLPAAEVRIMDWSNTKALQEACHGADAVVHAAGMNAAACGRDPAAALEVNGVWTARLVDAAARAGVHRFFYFSTAHVYASPLQGDIDENSPPCNLHPYASSHLAGELALRHTLASGRIAGAVLRLSNGFGVPASSDADCWSLLVNDLCRQAASRTALTLQSSGEQLRDFVTLNAVCAGVLMLLCTPETLPPVINIGGGSCMSVLDMARLIQARCQAVLGRTPPLHTGERKETALPLRYGSIHAQRLGLPSSIAEPELDALLTFCKTHFST